MSHSVKSSAIAFLEAASSECKLALEKTDHPKVCTRANRFIPALRRLPCASSSPSASASRRQASAASCARANSPRTKLLQPTRVMDGKARGGVFDWSRGIRSARERRLGVLGHEALRPQKRLAVGGLQLHPPLALDCVAVGERGEQRLRSREFRKGAGERRLRPPCGGGPGWGVALHFPIWAFEAASRNGLARPPSLALPTRGREPGTFQARGRGRRGHRRGGRSIGRVLRATVRPGVGSCALPAVLRPR